MPLDLAVTPYSATLAALAAAPAATCGREVAAALDAVDAIWNASPRYGCIHHDYVAAVQRVSAAIHGPW